MRQPGVLMQLVIVAAMLFGGSVAADDGRIYWLRPVDLADPTSRIFRADLGGSNIELVLEYGPGQANGFALDPENDRVYWAAGGAGILRAGRDGCHFIATDRNPWDVALDLQAEKVYWVDPINDTVERSDLDGANVEVLYQGVPGVSIEAGIALDLFHEKIYWVEFFRLVRANLDGTDVETVVDAKPKDVAVDPVGGKVYWIQQDPENISRANLDGTDVEILITFEGPTTYFQGVTLDLQGGKLYWAVGVDSPSEIARANLDGSDPEVLLEVLGYVSLPAFAPRGMTVGPITCSEPVPAVGRDALAVPIALMLVVSAFLLWGSRRPSNP